MGRTEKTGGGQKMRLKLLFFSLFAVFLIKGSDASTSYYNDSLPRWFDLLKNGNTIEKRLALHNLTFLHFSEFRKDTKVFYPILEALKDKDQSIREVAVECLKDIGAGIQKSIDEKAWSQNCCKNTGIVPALVDVLGTDVDPRVRAEAAKALGMYRSDRTGYDILDKEERGIEPLIKALKDTDLWVRLNASFSLGELKAPQAIEPLIALLEDTSDWRNKLVQQDAIAAIGKIGVADDKLVAYLTNKMNDRYLKAHIVEAFTRLPCATVKEVLTKESDYPNERIRNLVVKFIQRCQ